MKNQSVCNFCKKQYKNPHGLAIHFYYCYVKKFLALPLKKCSIQEYQELLQNSYFLPVKSYWPPEIYNFIYRDEVGMCKGIRYKL